MSGFNFNINIFQKAGYLSIEILSWDMVYGKATDGKT